MYLVIARCNRVTSEADIQYRVLSGREHLKGILWRLLQLLLSVRPLGQVYLRAGIDFVKKKYRKLKILKIHRQSVI